MANTGRLSHSSRCHAMAAFSGPAVAIFKSVAHRVKVILSASAGRRRQDLCRKGRRLRWVIGEPLPYLCAIIADKPLTNNSRPVTTAPFCTIAADQQPLITRHKFKAEANQSCCVTVKADPPFAHFFLRSDKVWTGSKLHFGSERTDRQF